jgi:5-formyltetrahydrofolate cyclo-ligase
MSTPREPAERERRKAELRKTELRARLMQQRDSLTEEDYAARSAAVTRLALTVPELRAARTVLAYWPLTHRREVDTRPLIHQLQADQKQIALPVVLSFTPRVADTPRLGLGRFTGMAALRPNRWGIHEPTLEKTVPPEEIDAVLVPAVGAGRNGHRIGYGFGYYDELLAGLRAPTLCLVFAESLVDEVPAAPHDQPISIIVTNDEILRPQSA